MGCSAGIDRCQNAKKETQVYRRGLEEEGRRWGGGILHFDCGYGDWPRIQQVQFEGSDLIWFLLSFRLGKNTSKLNSERDAV